MDEIICCYDMYLCRHVTLFAIQNPLKEKEIFKNVINQDFMTINYSQKIRFIQVHYEWPPCKDEGFLNDVAFACCFKSHMRYTFLNIFSQIFSLKKKHR